MRVINFKLSLLADRQVTMQHTGRQLYCTPNSESDSNETDNAGTAQKRVHKWRDGQLGYNSHENIHSVFSRGLSIFCVFSGVTIYSRLNFVILWEFSHAHIQITNLRTTYRLAQYKLAH